MFQTIISELGRIWNAQKSNDSSEVIQAWNSAQIVTGFDAKQIRKDVCGAWIVYEEFGLTNAKNGWLIDYYTEKSEQGDKLRMRALHVKNKIKKDAIINKNSNPSEDLNFCSVTAKD